MQNVWFCLDIEMGKREIKSKPDKKEVEEEMKSIKQLKEEITNKFFPEFTDYMSSVRDRISIMIDEVEEVKESLEDLQERLDEVENMRGELE